MIVFFLFAFSNGMEVDGFHIRVDLTGQNKKVGNSIVKVPMKLEIIRAYLKCFSK